MRTRTELRALVAVIMSLALYAGDGGARADEGDTRALFYFEHPLAGGGAHRQATFGFRLDAGRIVEGARWPLLDLRMQTRGEPSLRFSGVPVFGYTGEESVSDIPWWGWGLGALALACMAEAGICEDENNNTNQSGGSGGSEECPTCGL